MVAQNSTSKTPSESISCSASQLKDGSSISPHNPSGLNDISMTLNTSNKHKLNTGSNTVLQKDEYEEDKASDKHTSKFIDLDTLIFGIAMNNSYPPEVTKTLMRWLKDNMFYPYPTEDERIILCEKTGLSRKQLRGWLTDARRVGFIHLIHFREKSTS